MTMSTKRPGRACRRTGLLAIAMLASASPAVANDYRPDSLSERMAKSDLVIVGRPLQSKPANGSDFVVFQTELVVKGFSPGSIHVRVVEDIAEANFQCCEAPQYFLFLRKLPNGDYGTANGPFGVWPIPGPPVR